ncbi:MAG: phosphopantetheine-binding protein [Zoogloeaceae bacterium]|jgi:acyl carrier protein|nr:phosphopantetheine-binding protein [Zoogloeaceae bacterium]
MNLESRLDRVIKAIRVCKKNLPPVIEAQTRLQEDLNMDSFEILMLINELEAEFNIHITDADFVGVVTVGDVAHKLEQTSC